jgi:hypothetical protein
VGVVFLNTHSLMLCFHPKPSYFVPTLRFCNGIYSLYLFVAMLLPATFALHTLSTFFNQKECRLQKITMTWAL